MVDLKTITVLLPLPESLEAVAVIHCLKEARRRRVAQAGDRFPGMHVASKGLERGLPLPPGGSPLCPILSSAC